MSTVCRCYWLDLNFILVFNIVVIQKLVSEKDRMSSSTKPYSKWRDVRVQVMLIMKIVCYRLGLSFKLENIVFSSFWSNGCGFFGQLSSRIERETYVEVKV